MGEETAVPVALFASLYWAAHEPRIKGRYQAERSSEGQVEEKSEEALHYSSTSEGSEDGVAPTSAESSQEQSPFGLSPTPTWQHSSRMIDAFACIEESEAKAAK